ncbi:MAG: ssDNA-binding domain-containing protein [Chitinophagaceae bacterium]|nr:ssDNA-binding domain-containing protein [Chitinophagaceae bacterium]
MQQQTTSTLDVYQIVTDRIIELLEAGTVPWEKPWTDAGLPANLITRKAYNGINVFLLSSLAYEKNLFLTWQQVQEIGGKVIKGEKGHLIIFYKKLVKESSEAGEVPKEKQVPLLRYYKVFNVAQCENIPVGMIPESSLSTISPLRQCEEIIDAIPNPPAIQHQESKAYYSPVEDYINMPKLNNFNKSEEYYGVLFHELIHSTGHKTRLNRKEVTGNIEFGTKDYSIEELTGEIGAAFLKSFAGIADDNLTNTAAYIDGWLKVLKNDKRFIFYASSRAQQAVDYILNRREEKE